MKVTLRDSRESARTRSVLRRLFPMYIHDLSPYTSFYRMDERGRWRPELWRDWLSFDTVEPWLFEHAGEVIGFAVVGRQPFPYMSGDRDFKVCEFFVLSSWRRRGVGSVAAREVLGLHRGRWELTVLPGNVGALGFWKRVVGGIRGVEELMMPGEVVFRFELIDRDCQGPSGT